MDKATHTFVLTDGTIITPENGRSYRVTNTLVSFINGEPQFTYVVYEIGLGIPT